MLHVTKSLQILTYCTYGGMVRWHHSSFEPHFFENEGKVYYNSPLGTTVQLQLLLSTQMQKMKWQTVSDIVYIYKSAYLLGIRGVGTFVFYYLGNSSHVI